MDLLSDPHKFMWIFNGVIQVNHDVLYLIHVGLSVT